MACILLMLVQALLQIFSLPEHLSRVFLLLSRSCVIRVVTKRAVVTSATTIGVVPTRNTANTVAATLYRACAWIRMARHVVR